MTLRLDADGFFQAQVVDNPAAAEDSVLLTPTTGGVRSKSMPHSLLSGYGSALRSPDPAHLPIGPAAFAILRFAVVVEAAVMLTMAPAVSSLLTNITYAVLLVYLIFALASFVSSRQLSSRLRWLSEPLIDLIACTSILVLSDITTKGALLGLLFFTFVCALRRGFLDSALAVTVAGVVLVIGVILLNSPLSGLEVRNSVITALVLSFAGVAIAWIGYAESEFRRRVALLNELADIGNPRFGIDRTVALMMEKLRAHFGAERCVLVVSDSEGQSFKIRQATAKSQGLSPKAEPLAPLVGESLLSLSGTAAFSSMRSISSMMASAMETLFAHSHTAIKGEKRAESLATVAEVLDVESFISVPITLPDASGRLFVLRGDTFRQSELTFLGHVVSRMIPIVENLRLLDNLASQAADHERGRIARDLHDTTIQPFIGLKLGLVAVQQKLGTGSDDIAVEITKLIKLTEVELGEVRRYVTTLREGEEEKSTFVTALQRFTKKFSEASGIRVSLHADETLNLNDRLAAEAFQLVAEGLSNVRRHTMSKHASVSIGCFNNHLDLRIENKAVNGEKPAEFKPRSISERAAALGGEVRIVQGQNGSTHLHVSIPL
jgi:signal transduction histidine kinase